MEACDIQAMDTEGHKAHLDDEARSDQIPGNANDWPLAPTRFRTPATNPTEQHAARIMDAYSLK